MPTDFGVRVGVISLPAEGYYLWRPGAVGTVFQSAAQGIGEVDRRVHRVRPDGCPRFKISRSVEDHRLAGSGGDIETKMPTCKGWVGENRRRGDDHNRRITNHVQGNQFRVP